jgi:cholesterol oxidase
MWPNKGDQDLRPAQNNAYKRVEPVFPNQPFVPKGAIGELRVS